MISNEKAHKVLSMIYRFRILSYSQLYSLVFSDSTDNYCHFVIRSLSGNGYIDKCGYYRTSSYYFLTRNGISYLRKNGVLPLKGDDAEYYESLVSASVLNVKESYASHQLALNQFVIDFMCRYPDMDFEYFDEIYTSSIISNIRPDGIIKMNDTYYFLEMDMNTERKQRLMKKWESYRRFLNSASKGNFTLRIKVLFILGGNIKDIYSRKFSLSEYVLDNLDDKISRMFNIYVGDDKHLFEYLDKDILNKNSNIGQLLKWKGFKLSTANFTDEAISGFNFGYYLYKPTPSGAIAIEGGTPIEFIMDSFEDGAVLSLKNLTLFDKFCTLYSKEKGRSINYLMIVNSEKEAYYISSMFNIYASNVFFITKDRLQNRKSFNEALFKIDSESMVYHFMDGNIRIREDEGKLKILI